MSEYVRMTNTNNPTQDCSKCPYYHSSYYNEVSHQCEITAVGCCAVLMEKLKNSTVVFIGEPCYSEERCCWYVHQKSGDIVQTLFMTEEQAKTYKEHKDLYYRGIEKKVVED